MSSPLRTQFNNYMVLRRFSPKTQRSYINAVEGLAKFYKQSPAGLTNKEVQTYLLYLIQERNLSWSTCNIAFSSFRCLYNNILERKTTEFHLPPRPRIKSIPRLLSIEEVGKLLNATSRRKHRVLLMTAYGTGVRVSELVKLKPHHIESSRMMVRVEQGKGEKDRYTILPQNLLDELRIYWTMHQPREWLFPHRDGVRPMPIGTAQKIYYTAKQLAGITKGFGIHTLRHCFATHLMDQGVDIYSIKKMLGHTSIKTTAKYLHVTSKRLALIKSPLDDLYGI